MSGRLEGKVAIISGGARGQGAAETNLFVDEGARVLVGDVLEEEGRALVDPLGDAARFELLDVTDAGAWESAIAVAEEQYGRVDILVNNAGILVFHQLVSTPEEDFRRVLDVNLVGTFLGMKAVVPAMERAGGGSIINISSVGGLMGLPAVSAYVASKFGVRGLTKSAAIELGELGIRVNSVHPGGVNTQMIAPEGTSDEAFEGFYDTLPLRRIGTVDDVANLVLFLASDENSYSTGGEFIVDGGASAGDPTFMG